MRKYKIADVNKYEITPNRYVELRYFCLQYDELKHKREECYQSALRSTDGGSSSGGGDHASVPERLAERAAKYSEDIEQIERAAQLACGEDKGVIPFLLYHVTRGASYERVPLIPPCGRRMFYEVYRRRFFYQLDKMR